MAEFDAADNDASFLDYIERLGPECKSIREIIKTEIAEAMKEPQPGGGRSGNYLERQNQMLLSELLKVKGLPSIQAEDQNGPPNVEPKLPQPGGKEKPKPPDPKTPLKPFWR